MCFKLLGGGFGSVTMLYDGCCSSLYNVCIHCSLYNSLLVIIEDLEST